MKRTLVALAFALSPAGVLAQPPVEGTTHTFVDPTFVGTVFCDTFHEVLAIATAIEPKEVYRELFSERNERNEPRCAAVIPTGVVVSVTPLGIMKRDDLHFNAWAVETQIGNVTGYALYLEQFELVVA